MTVEYSNRKKEELIKDYSKEHELQLKQINENKYQFGFYRKEPKNKKKKIID